MEDDTLTDNRPPEPEAIEITMEVRVRFMLEECPPGQDFETFVRARVLESATIAVGRLHGTWDVPDCVQARVGERRYDIVNLGGASQASEPNKTVPVQTNCGIPLRPHHYCEGCVHDELSPLDDPCNKCAAFHGTLAHPLSYWRARAEQ